MADLSGVCDNHGIVVFCTDDAAATGTTVETIPVAPDFEATHWPPVWYWATCQHNVLTGKPNGPFKSRTTALADAVVMMSAHDTQTVLEGSEL